MSNLVECPHCQHKNLVEAEACEACGQPLTMTPAETADPADTLPQPLDIDANSQKAVTTRNVEPGPEYNVPRWGDAQIDERTQLVLQVIQDESNLVLDIYRAGSVILGRLPAEETPVLRVDLTPFEAVEAGVSREHVRFDLRDYSLYLTDQDSTNGTFLNGLRVLPRQPRIVRDGDEIRLGRLKLHIFLRRRPETAELSPDVTD